MYSDEEENLSLDLKVRAQYLRNLFTRLTSILRIHCEGYILVLSGEVDEVYIRLRSSIEKILQTEGFEVLADDYPKDSIPTSLHSMGEDADVYWESLHGTLLNFTGQIIEFCVSVGADDPDVDLAVQGMLNNYDEFIASFEKDRRLRGTKWLQHAEATGKKYREQFAENFLQKVDDTAALDTFVNPNRLSELRGIKSTSYDLTRLIELCVELNKSFDNECYMAVAMITRAILDHVPPIFLCKSFPDVSNNYGGTKSFKQSMTNLELSSRKIADAHLHSQIRSKEILPNRTQVNFSNDLDVLLAEIVRLLK